MNLRKKYERFYGKIDNDKEVHHIIPRHAGGDDSPENLQLLSKEEHKAAHLKRFAELGDFRDLCAYYMIGFNFSKAHEVAAAAGGRIGGRKTKDSGVGIFRNYRERRVWASMGGRVGARRQIEKNLGIHTLNTEKRREWSSLGGKVGSFTKSHIQSELGKRGGVKNAGFVWLTDGKIGLKYTKKQQLQKTVTQFLNENPTFRKGRPRCQN